MLSVHISLQQVQPLLNEDVAVAAVNGPSHCVISGTHQAVKNFELLLKEMDVRSRRLKTSHAFHSRMMASISEAFREHVKQTTLNEPQIPFVSNVTGKWITDDKAKNPGYWSDHILKTVKFSDGIGELLSDCENSICFSPSSKLTLAPDAYHVSVLISLQVAVTGVILYVTRLIL